MSDHKHLPIVTKHGDLFYVTCSRCGLLLSFKPLDDFPGMATWDVPEYEIPEGADEAPCRP